MKVAVFQRLKFIHLMYCSFCIGAQIGNVIALPVSALLCDIGFDNGWGSIFYVFGAYIHWSLCHSGCS